MQLYHSKSKRIFFLILFLCFSSFLINGQSFKGILKTLEKKAFDKVKKNLDKILEKDSLNIAARYVYSLYFLKATNPVYNVDSAHIFLLNTVVDFKNVSRKVMKRWEKAGITPSLIKRQHLKIDSLAFGIADSLHSEVSFQYFLDQYPTAIQVISAINKRDSAAYQQALVKNTHQALKHFFEKFPKAIHVIEAKEKYEALAFEQKTVDGTIESFETFLNQHPKSPFVDKAIFELYYLYTKDYKYKSFEKFLIKHDGTVLSKKAWSWLWYLSEDKSAFLKKFPQYPEKEHANHYITTLPITYFTFIEKEKFGFIDATGTVMIPAQFNTLSRDYLCKSITENIIIVTENNKEIAFDKTGKRLSQKSYDKVEYFSPGLLKVWNDGQVGLLEISGNLIIDIKYTDLKFIEQNLIIAQKGKAIGIITYREQQILSLLYDEIKLEKEGLITVKKGGKYAFTSKKELYDAFPEDGNNLKFIYNNYQFTHNNFLKTDNGDITKIQTLKGDILLETDGQLMENQYGWLLNENEKWYAINLDGKKVLPNPYHKFIINSKGYAVQADSLWGMIDFEGNTIIKPKYTAIHFLEDKGVLLENGDKKQGFFYSDTLLDFSEYADLQIKMASFVDSILTPYIITKNHKGRFGLLTATGEKILDNIYHRINFHNDSMISIEDASSKRGLFHVSGKRLLSTKYEGFASYKEGYVTTLKNKKFGLYSINKTKELKPQFDVLLKLYKNSDSIFIAKKGLFGLIDANNTEIVPFQFEKINYWNDSTLLVKHDSKWKLYDFINKYYLETFETFNYFKNTDDEIIIMTYRSSGAGLISNKKGRVISEDYSEIYNLHNIETPFYVAEKHIPAADLFIVLYIDKTGKVVKNLTLNEYEYNKLSCND